MRCENCRNHNRNPDYENVLEFCSEKCFEEFIVEQYKILMKKKRRKSNWSYKESAYLCKSCGKYWGYIDKKAHPQAKYLECPNCRNGI